LAITQNIGKYAHTVNDEVQLHNNIIDHADQKVSKNSEKLQILTDRINGLLDRSSDW
jgi:hypothetical protein